MAEGWRVVAQRQSEILTAAGSFESVVDVTFELSSGTTGTIQIPVRLYDEDYVRGEIERRASTMRAIENL